MDLSPLDLLYMWLAFLSLPVLVFLSYLSYQLLCGALTGLKHLLT